MSQHDFDITTTDANTGPTIRAAINAALQALATNNSGATPPSTTYPFQLWADTANDLLKQRNETNTAWLSIIKMSTGTLPDSSITTAKLAKEGTAGQVLTSGGAGANPSYQPVPASTVFASSAENVAGTIENKAVDPLGIREAFNATGSAPVYACRAWVNFNGTGTVAIRASGNVSSITDNGTGDYTVNFITAMPDTNYTVAHATRIPASAGYNTLAMRLFGNYNGSVQDVAPLTSSFRIGTAVQGVTNNSDGDYICLSVFR
jgi:hypothetical protein